MGNASKSQYIDNRLVICRGKEIGSALHNDEWWFSIIDIVEVLTESTDHKKTHQKNAELNSYWGTICIPLPLQALDGKMRKTNCANTEEIVELSFPSSSKDEPFKCWIKVGCERGTCK